MEGIVCFLFFIFIFFWLEGDEMDRGGGGFFLDGLFEDVYQEEKGILCTSSTSQKLR